MSPVEPRGRGHTGRAVLVSTIGVIVVMGGLFAAALAVSDQDSTSIGLGDQTFQGGDAGDLADEIAERGPIFYSDTSGRGQDRPIILQHLGDDPSEGWYAFLAYPEERSAACTWQWQPDEELFRADCDDDLTAPADGEGLQRFPVEVVDGRLDVDLNAAERSSTTTEPETTSSVTITGDEVPEDGDGG